jgi:hypothetical protein
MASEDAVLLIAPDGANCTLLGTDCATCVTLTQCVYCMDGSDDGGGLCLPNTTSCFQDFYSYYSDTTCGVVPGPTDIMLVNLIVLGIGLALLYLVIRGCPSCSCISCNCCRRAEKVHATPEEAEPLNKAEEGGGGGGGPGHRRRGRGQKTGPVAPARQQQKRLEAGPTAGVRGSAVIRAGGRKPLSMPFNSKIAMVLGTVGVAVMGRGRAASGRTGGPPRRAMRDAPPHPLCFW